MVEKAVRMLRVVSEIILFNFSISLARRYMFSLSRIIELDLRNL